VPSCDHARGGSVAAKLISYGLQVERAQAFGLLAQYLGWNMQHEPAAVMPA
jgi:hypothetical protein